MMDVAFVDLEVDGQNRIVDMGAVFGDRIFHQNRLDRLMAFVKPARFVCGHHFLGHDFVFLKGDLAAVGLTADRVIDTLLLSPLLFPARPYHALDKDYKLEFEESNNPLTDCQITRALLDEQIQAFACLPLDVQRIFYQLLRRQAGFGAFFLLLEFEDIYEDLATLIGATFLGQICANAPLARLIEDSAVELAYALALIFCQSRYSITPVWLQYQYPKIEPILLGLCYAPCGSCAYCQSRLNATLGLKRYFNLPRFRTFGDRPLQEAAANAAILGESLLAVFPTGGGKSVTFQVPALMAGECAKALTVVISPLQSLMKDQVDNLERQNISEAVTLNGLLDPIERQKAVERVQDGSASLLYISPESLRSRTIENLLLGRNIARFVIDEAHCFSAWGQDFRVDYLYIGEFIRLLMIKKQLDTPIPVSCFTATAKMQVIEDICAYFKQRLNLDLKRFIAPVARKNLHYQVIAKANEEEKYQALRQLIDKYACPTIVYVSRTKRTFELSQHLQADGFNALAYHGKMDAEEKIHNQNAFKADQATIMVATSAFGMGVDKPNVGLVVHYDISDSLENYIQEAGRAGRSEKIFAKCYVLFNETDDLDKHFTLLNQTKIAIHEIKQIWRAIKELCGSRPQICESALQIARQAGWKDDHTDEIETRVKTAILALEEAGYIKRGQNMPRVFATSILSKNAMQAIDKINQSTLIHPDEKMHATRIIKKLFSYKRQQATEENGESRVDYLADLLGLKTERVIRIITWLKEEGILADQKDLQASIGKNTRTGDNIAQLNRFINLEATMLTVFTNANPNQSFKELTQSIQNHLSSANPKHIQTLIHFWKIKNWLGRKHYKPDDLQTGSNLGFGLTQDLDTLKTKLDRKAKLAEFIVRYVSDLAKNAEKLPDKDWIEIHFSVCELKSVFNHNLLADQASLDEIEDTLFYLTKIGILKIEGGFLVLHQRLAITRLEKDNRKQYTLEDYKKLAQYYERRKEQIHIVGKYAHLMQKDEKRALALVNDYFALNYTDFLQRYFNQDEKIALKRNITAQRFNKWFGNLSPKQLQIIQDDKSRAIVVFAAPGSGKTRVLVHKLAALYQLEDVKHEGLLMLTFSRSAVHEFKARLFDIMGNAASYIEIKTFHAYCFDLLGRVGDLNEAKDIVHQACIKIQNGEVETNRIAKTVLVIDEAQDMNAEQFELITTLMQHNEDMRVIAVGDDDQTIYAFAGASPDYMRKLLNDFDATSYDLNENHRSATKIVDFCNGFAKHISQRLKTQEVVAVSPQQGRVLIVNFTGNILTHLLDQIRTAYNSTRSVAVLTQTNDEAIWLAGQLGKVDIPHKLVQSNQGFRLHDLLEIRVFEHYLAIQTEQITLDPKTWQNAKQKTAQYLAQSQNLPILHNILHSFELANPKRKYVSDWRIFIQESQLEDFYHPEKGVVTLSTIHKAKGREFDQVFVLIDKTALNHPLNDTKKREFYVAFSRAKSDLTLLSNHKTLLDLLPTDSADFTHHQGDTLDQRELVLYLSHKEVYLDRFEDFQTQIKPLQAGANLQLFEWGCTDQQGNPVIIFSNGFKEKLQKYQQKGYRLHGAKINFVVLWQKKTDKQNPANIHKEIRILLPIVYLKR